MNTATNDNLSKIDINRRKVDLRRSIILAILLAISMVLGAEANPEPPITVADISSSLVLFAALLTMTWWAIKEYVEADEFQRLVQLKAAAFSFLVVIFAILAVSIIDMLGFTYRASMQLICAGGVLIWLAVRHWLTTRSLR